MSRTPYEQKQWARALILPDVAFDFTLEAAEKRAVVRALKESEGKIVPAGRLLRIGKTTLYRKLEQYGLRDWD